MRYTLNRTTVFWIISPKCFLRSLSPMLHFYLRLIINIKYQHSWRRYCTDRSAMNGFGFLHPGCSESRENFSRKALTRATQTCKYPNDHVPGKDLFPMISDYQRSYTACYSCKPAASWESTERRIRAEKNAKDNNHIEKANVNRTELPDHKLPAATEMLTEKTALSVIHDYGTDYHGQLLVHDASTAARFRGQFVRHADQPLRPGRMQKMTTSASLFPDYSPTYSSPDNTGSSLYQNNLRRSLGHRSTGPIIPPEISTANQAHSNSGQRSSFGLGECGFPDFHPPRNVSVYSKTFAVPALNRISSKPFNGKGVLATPSPEEHISSQTESSDAYSGLSVNDRNPVTFTIPFAFKHENGTTAYRKDPGKENDIEMTVFQSALPILRNVPEKNPDFAAIRQKLISDHECIENLNSEAKRQSAQRLARRVDCSIPGGPASFLRYPAKSTYSVEHSWLTGCRPEVQLPQHHDMKSLINYGKDTPAESVYKEGFRLFEDDSEDFFQKCREVSKSERHPMSAGYFSSAPVSSVRDPYQALRETHKHIGCYADRGVCHNLNAIY